MWYHTIRLTSDMTSVWMTGGIRSLHALNKRMVYTPGIGPYEEASWLSRWTLSALWVVNFWTFSLNISSSQLVIQSWNWEKPTHKELWSRIANWYLTNMALFFTLSSLCMLDFSADSTLKKPKRPHPLEFSINGHLGWLTRWVDFVTLTCPFPQKWQSKIVFVH